MSTYNKIALMLIFSASFASGEVAYEDLQLEEISRLAVSDVKLDKNVVLIGGFARTIDKSTSCAPSSFGNKKENSCQCCLAKHQMQNQSAQDAFSYCTTEKDYCTEDNLRTVARDLNIPANNNLAQLSSEIYQKINKLPLVDLNPRLQQKLSPSDVIALLKQAENQNSLVFPGKLALSSNPHCYEAKVLAEAGGATLQLFMLSYSASCPNTSRETAYIIKEMKRATDEVRNLVEVEEAFKTNDPENLKYLSMPIANIAYVDSSQRAHYISIIPTAPGKSLKAWLDWYYDSPSETNKGVVRNIFYNFGKTLAKIHIKHMSPAKAIFGKTWTHSDAHLGNVFASDDGVITLIDNETFADSLQSLQNVDKDLLLTFLLSTVTGDSQNVIKKADMSSTAGIKTWFSLNTEPMIKGYADEYLSQLGTARKVELKKALKEVFVDQSIASLARLGKFVNYFTYSKYKGSIDTIIDDLFR